MKPLMNREQLYLVTRHLNLFSSEEQARKKVVVQTDQAGAEALVVAYISPKGRYRQLFENSIKVHSYVAMHLFRSVWERELGQCIADLICSDISELKKHILWARLAKLIASSDDWPPSRRYYYMAKMICHACNYGMKARTFVINLLKKSEGQIMLAEKVAHQFIEMYHSLFPEIRRRHLEVINQLDKDRTLYNLFGDRRIFNGHWDDTLHRSAIAFTPQSTVGCLTSYAIDEIQDQIDAGNPEYSGIDILANWHDAIFSQVTIGGEQRLATIHERHLGKTFLANTENQFTMKSESSWGFNGYELQKLKNN